MIVFEEVLLANLFLDGDRFGRRVMAFIKPDYFREPRYRVVFELISTFFFKYNAFPTKAAMYVDLAAVTGINEEVFKEAKETIEAANEKWIPDNDARLKWLMDTTEQFCREQALHGAMLQALKIMEDAKNKNKKNPLTTGAIPQLMQDALGVSFDKSVGHDYLEDFDLRYEKRHTNHKRIPFDIDYLNEITGGGVTSKTMTVFMAATGQGKSLVMSHCASYNLMCGYNVLYLTMEMDDVKVADRIDANLMNFNMSELKLMTRDEYGLRIDRIRGKTKGKIIIKAYSPIAANVQTFKVLLEELKLKKQFVPDVLYVDYINICSSSRMKFTGESYFWIKAIAEELRGLAMDCDIPLFTATQVNRNGAATSDFDLTDTAESWGLPATADLFLAVITTPELTNLNQVMFKQLKNRDNDVNKHAKFIVGRDPSLMKLYNLEQSAQLIDTAGKPVATTPVHDFTGFKFGEE